MERVPTRLGRGLCPPNHRIDTRAERRRRHQVGEFRPRKVRTGRSAPDRGPDPATIPSGLPRDEYETWARWGPPGELRGINLRSWIVLELAETGRVLTVSELTDRLEASGLTVPGRVGKTISDALRWEVRRGRAVRLGRGRYALGRVARVTRHRMRRRIAATRARLRAHAPVGDDAAGAVVDEAPEVRVIAEALVRLLGVVARKRNQGNSPAPPPVLASGLPPP